MRTATRYLALPLNGQELIDMLRQLENGLTSITPGIAQHMLEDLGAEDRQTLHPQSAQDEMSEQLTERHKMILKLVAGGATYKEAAETLGLTERTIKYHMGRIVEILQLKNRSQAIAFAVRARLVDTDQDAID